MPIPRKIVLFRKNDQYIELLGLKDLLTDQFQNSATVTATLKNDRGDVQAGVNGLVLTNFNVNGDYRGLVNDAVFDPDLGSGYVLEIKAVNGSIVMLLELITEVVERRVA